MNELVDVAKTSFREKIFEVYYMDYKKTAVTTNMSQVSEISFKKVVA